MEQQKLELIDIYDISYNPWWLSFWFKTVLVCLAVASVSALVYFLYKKYCKKPVVPYWQRALDKLMILSKYKWLNANLPEIILK